ncbi:molybdopterin-dependent oxidoreductase [Desulfovibrionales bacterium]
MNEQEAVCVGSSLPRYDALAKAAGKEPYAADLYPDNLLWAGAVRSGVACGELLGLETSKALAVPGVVRVLTAADVPGPNRHGIIHRDTPVLVDGRIRHAGDAVALVLAETRSALRQAIGLIQPKIKPLPAVFDPITALEPDAPCIHEEHPGNILLAAEIRKGEAERVLAECEVVVHGEFSTPMQAQIFLETENGVAWCTDDGILHMTVSTQSPFRDRLEVGAALGLAYDRIHIVAPCLGGGFGGKDGATVQCLLALAALHADGRPVKIHWEREESMVAGYKRHPCRLRYSLGADRDGTLRALSCSLVYDTGAYAHLGGEVMELGMEHAGGPYRIAHVLIKGQCVYTNNPVAGAMRAFGICQVAFAMESMMDMLAQKLGMNPLALRMRNALVLGDVNCAGLTLTTSTGLTDCLSMLADHPLWRESHAWKDAAPAQTRRGVGLAAIYNAAGYGGKVRDAAIAKIELDTDGQIVIHNAVSDMGQGNACGFVQIARVILGQDSTNITLRQPDTTSAYPSGSSSAGRTTYTFGNALIKACDELRERLINRAGLLLFLDSDLGLRLEPGRVVHGPTGREVSLKQLATFMTQEDRVCIHHFVAPVCQQVPETSTGFFVGFPHVIFTYGAHLARIEVDLATGQIRVCGYLAVTDGGTVLNPSLFDQQIQGGVAQGLGYALMEEVRRSHGLVQTDNLATYLIPTTLDIPEILSCAVASHEATGPFGLKGVGEIAMNGPLPAVANAVADACQKRLCHAPLTPEQVLMALENLV